MSLIHVSTKLRGDTVTVEVALSDTIEELKTALLSRLPILDAKVLFRGKTLRNEGSVVEAGLKDGSAVMLTGLVDRPPAAAAATASADRAADAMARILPLLEEAKRAVQKLAVRDTSLHHRSRAVMELQDQAGRIIAMPPADESALKEGMLLLQRARASLRAASRAGQRLGSQAEAREGARALSAGCGAPPPPSEGPAVGALLPVPPSPSAATRECHEQLLLALALCQEASTAFDRVDTRYVHMVDNAAMCWLQTAWLYFRLGFTERLAGAAVLLQQARAALAVVHGPNLERLRALRGEGSVERALYVRLDFLEGVVAQLSGRHGDALRLLQRARQACDVLQCSPAAIAALASCGIPRRRAIKALRATATGASPAAAAAAATAPDAGVLSGDTQAHVGRAVEWHFAEAERRAAVDARRRELARLEERSHRYGPTASGANVNVAVVDAMRDIAVSLEQEWEEALVVEAVRQADNDREQALTLLIEQRDVLEVVLEKRRAERAARRDRRNAAKEAARAARLEARFAAAASASAASATAASAAAGAAPASESLDARESSGAPVEAAATAAVSEGTTEFGVGDDGGVADFEEDEDGAADGGSDAESEAAETEPEDADVTGLLRDIHSHKRQRGVGSPAGSPSGDEGASFPNEDCLTGDDSLEEVSQSIDGWLVVVQAPGRSATPSLPPSRYSAAFGF